MPLVDPTGKPIKSENKISDSDLIQVLTSLRVRMDAANAQLVQLGLLLEYLYEQLGKQGIEIPMDDFNTWAKKRYEEIQEEAKKMMNEGFAEDFVQQAEDALNNLAKADAQVDLNDE